MIENAGWIWFAVGLLAGSLHATMLWRSAQRAALWSPLVGLVRLAVVATLLVVAAMNGGILSSAAGWAVGFMSLCVWFLARRPRREIGSSRSPSGEQSN